MSLAHLALQHDFLDCNNNQSDDPLILIAFSSVSSYLPPNKNWLAPISKSVSVLPGHMGPEGPSNFIKKLKGSVLAIFFFVVT